MKIFYFRKNNVVWGIILIIIIVALFALMRLLNGGSRPVNSENIFMILNNFKV